MDQLAKYTESEILDLSEPYPDFDCAGNSWLSSTLDLQKVNAIENHKIDRQVQNDRIMGAPVSAEELKIRSELEMEVERDLEEEIKDNIYHLSLRLHRLYQRQKERNVKEASESDNQQDNRNRAVSEVNISIKMEGKTKIEIKESKKEASERGRSVSYRSENVKEEPPFSGKKFDWEKTLRAGSGPVSVNKTNGSSKQRDKMLRSDSNIYSNRKFENGRGKNDGSSGQGKGDGRVDNKLLQLGWKV